MAAPNVFGEPVTDETVRKYFANKQVITRKDRAYLAYNLREAERKNEKADAYVLKLKEKYGDGIATLVTIYNATGDTLTYFREHDFSGHIGEAPYPRQIQNGQWAAFLHVAGSSAAVLYRGLNYDESGGEEYVWLHSWYNVPSNPKKYVYTEIRKPAHYDAGDIWNWVYPLIKSDSYKETSFGCYSGASITQNNPYKYSGTMTLQFVP
ncbi:23 kDa jasmonate-induced protein [Ziziphus jujuba]|uniref:23 kDa jasmonate-induced protein n=1 Tax=Ziziphus jujuba TaxID=326968 RepID=A0ABM4AEV7_ZIZJJ|nr:23 kDa jasmonate-induced protein [Ziziphus jujuba]